MNEIHIPVLALEDCTQTFFISKGEWYGKSEHFIRKLATAHEVIYDIRGVDTTSLTEDEWYVLMDTKPLEATPEGWELREEIFERIWRTADEVNFYVK
jgi:hypothetical protein